MTEEEEVYRGSFVILRPVDMGYFVTVDPPLPDGHDRTRTFAMKNDAWRYASGLWSEHRLPLRDETDGNTARQFSE
jgi:hypothetical protein